MRLITFRRAIYDEHRQEERFDVVLVNAAAVVLVERRDYRVPSGATPKGFGSTLVLAGGERVPLLASPMEVWKDLEPVLPYRDPK